MHKLFPTNLLALLIDQKIHSGESLGRSLNISRAAIWKQLKIIQAFGVKIESIKGQGYRLIENIDLLDDVYIKKALKNGCGIDCDVLIEVDSTNSMLMRLIGLQSVASGKCIVAEMQMMGRGRRGKHWISPFAKNLYFSVLWNFNNGVAGLEGLSLVIGISIVQGLKKIGVNDAMLKWPNDVLVSNKKLAGILLEVSGDPVGFCNVVIGVGLNVFMQDREGIIIDQPWVSLEQLVDAKICRSDLFILLMENIVANLHTYEKFGFAYFFDEWKIHDGYFGKEVMVTYGDKEIIGIAQGVNPSGELLVKTGSIVQAFNGGEVSLRRVH